MRKLMLAAAFLLATASAEAGTVVGNVDGLLIVKEGGTYRLVPPRRNKKSPPQKIPASPEKSRPSSTEELFREIVFELENGAGKPVYSRINGIDVDRVLDKGRYFGAVVEGSADEKALKKAFKYVVKRGNKYYVVGEWK